MGLNIGGSWPFGCPRPVDILRTAVKAEKLGFTGLWSGDHVAAHCPNLDSLTLLSAMAAVTERVTIGTAVFLLGLRNPVVVAKAVASLDYLSRGRVVFGVGVGGEREGEWAACGVQRSERGARVDEGLVMLRKLWASPKASHKGKFWSFEDTTIAPAPEQPGGPPVIIGGRSDAAVRRASRYDGWVGYLLSPERLSEVRKALVSTHPAPDELFLGHLLFVSMGAYREAKEKALQFLEARYLQPFDKLVDRYCLVGDAKSCANRMTEFFEAGAEHIILAPLCEAENLDRVVEEMSDCLLPIAPLNQGV